MIRPRSATHGAMRIQDLPQSLKDDQTINENGVTSQQSGKKNYKSTTLESVIE